jgi:phosphate-selective porin OprO/OprP
MEGRLSYALGIFNGVADGASADVDINDGKEGAARLFALPFKKSSVAGLQDLGFGLAGTLGSSQGTMTATGLSVFKTVGQQTFFSYRTGKTAPEVVTADGRRSRLSPQAYYYVGRFGIQAEYAISSMDVRIDTVSEVLKNRSWQSSASCLLTKDRASWKGVDPRRPFDPSARGWGALELAARFGWLKVDDDAFPVFADPEESARKAREWAFELNWYLNRNVRFMLQRGLTAFKGGAVAGGDREDEKVILGRIQMAF